MSYSNHWNNKKLYSTNYYEQKTIRATQTANQDRLYQLNWSYYKSTQATLNEVFEYEAEGDKKDNSEKKKDIHEIINYRHALELGVKSLKTTPLAENLVKKLHSILLRSGRGQNKAPGAFRKTQVYIGKQGADIEDATFIPPRPTKSSHF